MKSTIKHCFILATLGSLFTSFEATAQTLVATEPVVNVAVGQAINRVEEEDTVSMPGTRGAVEGRALSVDLTRTTVADLRAQQNFLVLRDNMEGQTVLQIQEQGKLIYDKFIATSPSLAVSYQAAFETKAAVRFQHKLAALTQAYYNAEAAIRFTGTAYGPVPPFPSPALSARAQTFVNFVTVGIRSSFPYLNTADTIERGPGGWAQFADLVGTPIGRAAQFARLYDTTGR